MKRILVIIGVMFAVGSVFADEQVLIDFSKLTSDILQGQEQQGILPQNKQTLMDFSGTAGNSYTSEQKSVMKTSLAIDNWLVTLAQSSQTVLNKTQSYVKTTASAQYGNVLGVRVHFPVANYNSWARIAPPFDIPAYEFSAVSDDGVISAPQEKPNFVTGVSRFQNGYGVVKNVGSIKAIAVEAYGLNFPCTLSAVFADGSGKEQVVAMGSLRYDGWAQLRWDNPQYIQNVRNRAVRLYPLYPTNAPYIRFAGFIVQRDAADTEIVGNDFVAYFKEVRVIYDKAELETERDIDDEATWDIVSERESDRQKVESKSFGTEQVIRFLEERKKAPESTFTAAGATTQP
jgi:hypothetical protein